jgi:phosphoethanolamine N-methyltransferase
MEVPAQGSTSESEETRAVMVKYWEEHADNLTSDAMMLDDDSAKIDAGDRAEVLAMVPDLEGKAACEVGAGIGRFTEQLITQKRVASLDVSDFMLNYIDKNREVNGHHELTGALTFSQQDVTKYDFGEAKYDHVFTNWIFMYLTDEETADVFKRVYASLKPGGTFFMRESCFKQSGNRARSFNPTNYRSDELYESLVTSANSDSPFAVVKRCANQTYIEVKNNPNQLMWLWQKPE